MAADQARAIRRAKALMAVAQHPNTPPAEASTAHRLGRLLMLREGLTDADLGAVSPAMRYNADPDAKYDRQYRPTTPAQATPGRKWTVYERAAAAADGDGWAGLGVTVTVRVWNRDAVEGMDLVEWLRRYGSSTS